MDCKFVSLILLIFIQTSEGQRNTCNPKYDGTFEMSFSEIFATADIIVYGRVLQHFATKFDNKYVVEADYEVLCVLKREDREIESEITITSLAPRDACSGSPVAQVLRIGDHSILALKNTTADHTRYDLDEFMPATPAAFKAQKPYFLSLSKLCWAQNWEVPVGASENKCPVCGIADFEPNVTPLSTDVPVCSYTQSTIVSNMTACDLYMDFTLEEANNQTCVPANYIDTCMTLMYRDPTMTCECQDPQAPREVNVGHGNNVLPSFVVTTVLVILSMSFL